MSQTARDAAYRAFTAFRKSGAWSDAALASAIAAAGLDARDAALASRICYGTIQNLLLCDYYAAHFCTMPLRKLEPQVLDILRLSIYQIVFLERVPNAAAVNEGVLLTKRHANPRAAGLVNAVLRRIAENSNKLPPIRGESALEILSIRYSHPLELCRSLAAFLSEAELEAFLKANNEETPTYAQVNGLKAEAASVLSELAALGADARPHQWQPGCIELTGVGAPQNLAPFQRGELYIQDPAARASVRAAFPIAGGRVIDACAAPGGKSFAAAIEMGGAGEILALDIHEKKLGRIRSGAERLGIDSIRTRCGDARVLDDALLASADLVIVDAPCSGYGVIRKKPEIRFKPLSETAGLPKIQLDILNTQAQYVKPGGKLLYSTCTVLPRENEAVAEAFLGQNPDFERAAFSVEGLELAADNGMITLYPHIHGTDGFFISIFRRIV